MSDVTVTREGPRGMLLIRGDLSASAVKKAATGVAGVTMPGPLEAPCAGESGILWMSPDELLVLCPHDAAVANLEKLQAALAGTHHLAATVSDMRAMFTLRGPGLRDVLAKLTPADMSPGAFPVGQVRRTRLAQVAAAVWLTAEDAAQVICFRSVGDYMQELLETAAAPGTAVGYYA